MPDSTTTISYLCVDQAQKKLYDIASIIVDNNLTINLLKMELHDQDRHCRDVDPHRLNIYRSNTTMPEAQRTECGEFIRGERNLLELFQEIGSLDIGKEEILFIELPHTTIKYLLVDSTYNLLKNDIYHRDVDIVLGIGYLREKIKEECPEEYRDFEPKHMGIYCSEMEYEGLQFQHCVREVFKNGLARKLETTETLACPARNEYLIIVVPPITTVWYTIFDERRIIVKVDYIHLSIKAFVGHLKRKIQETKARYLSNTDPSRLALYIKKPPNDEDAPNWLFVEMSRFVRDNKQNELDDGQTIEELDITEESTVLVHVDVLTSSSRKQLRLLHDQARDLDGQILRLNDEKAAIFRSVNDIQATTKNLPPEILSKIFQFCRPPIDFSTHEVSLRQYEDEDYPRIETYQREEFVHFDLAAVSHRWRQVVWSTPQLWSSISLGIRKSIINNSLSCLNLHCQNARQLPMSIELDFRESQDENERLTSADLCHLEPIKTALFSHVSSKVQELILIGVPFEWVASTKFELPQCRRMTINRTRCWDKASWEADPAQISFVGSPCLQSINLYETQHIALSCSTVRVLHLQYSTYPVFLQSLQNCPNLVKCECTDTYSTAPKQVPQNLIVLEHLDSLSWDYVDGFPCRAFLLQVRFSKLCTLRLDSFRTGEEWVSFFSQLPTTLSSLTLGRFFGSTPTAASFLGWLPQLSELGLVDCQFREFISILANAILNPANMIEATPESFRDGFPRGAFLPSLSKLSIFSGRPHVDDILDMLKAMHRTRGSFQGKFHLVLDREERWHELGRIRALVSTGFDIELTLESEKVSLDKI